LTSVREGAAEPEGRPGEAKELLILMHLTSPEDEMEKGERGDVWRWW